MKKDATMFIPPSHHIHSFNNIKIGTPFITTTTKTKTTTTTASTTIIIITTIAALMVFLASCGSCTANTLTQNPDTPEFMSMWHAIVRDIQGYVSTELEPVLKKVEEVKSDIGEICGGGGGNGGDRKDGSAGSYGVNGSSGSHGGSLGISNITTTLDVITQNLDSVKSQFTGIEHHLQSQNSRTNQMSKTISHDLEMLKEIIPVQLNDSNQLFTFVLTEELYRANDEVKQVLNRGIEDVVGVVKDVNKTCMNNELKVQELKGMISDLEAKMEELSAKVDNMKVTVEIKKENDDNFFLNLMENTLNNLEEKIVDKLARTLLNTDNIMERTTDSLEEQPADFMGKLMEKLTEKLTDKILEKTKTNVTAIEDLPAMVLERIDQTLGSVDRAVDHSISKAQVDLGEVVEALKGVNATCGRVEEEVEEVKVRVTAVEGRIEEVKEEVVEAVEGVSETCGRGDEIVEDILSRVNTVMVNVEEVKDEVERTGRKVEEAVENGSKADMTLLRSKVEDLSGEVDSLRNTMQEELEEMAGKVEGLTNVTQQVLEVANCTLLRPEKVKEEEEEEDGTKGIGRGREEDLEAPIIFPTPVPVFPCQDSTFGRVSSDDICGMTVRFNRCSLPYLSFHCCHTCTRSGNLPEMGPWRHKNMTRTVSVLNILTYFAP